jgi:DNA polymerase III alpha subunit
VSSHPLAEHQSALDAYGTCTTKQIAGFSEGRPVMLGAMLTRVKRTVTKTGRGAGAAMAMITLEDFDGTVDGVLFPDTMADVTKKSPEILSEGSIAFVKGKIDRRREMPSIIVEEMIPISDAATKLTRDVRIRLSEGQGKDVIETLKSIFSRHRGGTQVSVVVPANGMGRVMINLDKSDWGVKPDKDLVDELKKAIGPDRVSLLGEGSRRAPVKQKPLFETESAEPETVSASTSPAGEVEMIED